MISNTGKNSNINKTSVSQPKDFSESKDAEKIKINDIYVTKVDHNVKPKGINQLASLFLQLKGIVSSFFYRVITLVKSDNNQINEILDEYLQKINDAKKKFNNPDLIEKLFYLRNTKGFSKNKTLLTLLTKMFDSDGDIPLLNNKELALLSKAQQIVIPKGESSISCKNNYKSSNDLKNKEEALSAPSLKRKTASQPVENAIQPNEITASNAPSPH